MLCFMPRLSLSSSSLSHCHISSGTFWSTGLLQTRFKDITLPLTPPSMLPDLSQSLSNTGTGRSEVTWDLSALALAVCVSDSERSPSKSQHLLLRAEKPRLSGRRGNQTKRRPIGRLGELQPCVSVCEQRAEDAGIWMGSWLGNTWRESLILFQNV